MNTASPDYNKILTNPESAIEQINLVYINNKQLTILRERDAKAFRYLYKGKRLTEKEHLNRIKELVIPPAWEDVKIAELPNGHLQAVGRDAKRRKQYRYHPTWVKLRNQTKFFKMTSFGSQLPKIRKQVRKDLQQKGWPRTKALALVVKLLEETHIRVGGEQYAKRNKTYGLSTLRKKHVDIYKDRIKFKFIGKKGKEHSVTLKNRRMIKLVGRCEEIPGWELFHYYDEHGEKHNIDSGMVNDYIHRIAGNEFTAKDFRTWAASIIFFEMLMEMGIEEDPKQSSQNVIEAIDKAALELGNTRAVCKKYYIHPFLVQSYENGNLDKAFSKVDRVSKPKQFFSASEEVVLKLLKKYKPHFGDKEMKD